MTDRHDAAAREWLRARKNEDDEHGGLMPRRMYPPDTLAESLAELLRSTADAARAEECERCAKVAENKHGSGSYGNVEEDHGWNVACGMIAAAIRALGSEAGERGNG